MRFAAGGAGGGVAGSAAASVTDLAALGAQRYGYGELEAVSDEDMPEDFGLSGKGAWQIL